MASPSYIAAMYYSYFGLKEAPFSIAPNPQYLLMTERHQEALAHLYHGIHSDAGFVLLTGEVGTGKTTVCRQFFNDLPHNTQIAFVLNPCLDRLELLQAICQELHIASIDRDASLRQLSDSIYEYLLANHAKGINTVLLIDEAQQIDKSVLELIRLLTNLETDTQKLLKIILVGQPELNDILAQPDLLQLSQRITARYHIKPLTVQEVGAYVEHRLLAAGFHGDARLFPLRVIQRLFVLTKGVPRLINVVCDRALLGVYSQGRCQVSVKILHQAFNEVCGNYSAGPKKYTGFIAKSFWGAVVMLLFATAMYMWQPAMVKPFLDASKNTMIASLATIYRGGSVPVFADTNDQPDVKPPLALPLDTSIFFHTKVDAESRLFGFLEPTGGYKAASCANLVGDKWRCGQAQVFNWSAFKKYNRPALVHLSYKERQYYAVVVAMTSTQAVVYTRNDSVLLPLSELGEYWSGEFTYLWQGPAVFERYIYKHSAPSTIAWLAKAFATLDGRDSRLADKKYNTLLQQRIKLFQRSHQLKEDGVAGVETLLTLNERLGVAVTLDTPASSLLEEPR